METRVLGNSGIKVSPLGMGCMGLTHAYGKPLPDTQAQQIIQAAFNCGYTFFDTAQCYVGTRNDGTTTYNEEVMGAALASVRDQVVIASKFGVTHAPDKTILVDSKPQTIRTSIDESLRRLHTNYIDLYYQHRIDPNVEPEEVASVMADLIKEGKIRAWGISEANENYIRRAHAVCPVAAIQNRYSLMARWHESLFPVLEELNIAFVAFSPIANGFLATSNASQIAFRGEQDYRADMPQYTSEGQAKAQPLVDLISELATAHQVTPAQISLAWMLCKKPWIIPIPGTRKVERLQENLEAAHVMLSDAEIAQIDHLTDTLDFAVFGGHSVSCSTSLRVAP